MTDSAAMLATVSASKAQQCYEYVIRMANDSQRNFDHALQFCCEKQSQTPQRFALSEQFGICQWFIKSSVSLLFFFFHLH